MEPLKCHHGDCPRDISIQDLEQENKSARRAGPGGGKEGSGPLPAPIRAGGARRPPVPQFPRWGDAGGCGAESPARVVLLVERNSSADAKIKNGSPGKRVMRLLSWVIAGDYESRVARRGLK